MSKNEIQILIEEYELQEMPAIIKYLVAVLKNKYKWLSLNSHLANVLAILSMCLSSKRSKVKENQRIKRQ